jgi:hypothetical protein
MLLALEGSIEQKEVTPEQAEKDRRMIERLHATQRDKTVVLYEEEGAEPVKAQ